MLSKTRIELLKFLIKTDNNIQIRHVLWMIYEGNDLEDSYARNWTSTKTPIPT